MRPQPRRASGQALVEFALCAIILTFLIFGIIELSRYIQAQVTVNNAARAAIRYAVTGQQVRDPLSGQWITRTVTIQQVATDGLTGLALTDTNDYRAFGFHQVDINPPDGGQAGQNVEVTVYYNLTMVTPLVSAILPQVLLSATERAINEQWGAVQNFDHANLPPVPPPLPTWTPIPTPTWTPTSTPTRTPTRTPTNTPTRTPTNTPTWTPTSTPTKTPTP